MPGLQCWDGGGNLVVDLGDYSCRWAGTVNISIPKGQSIGSVGFGGINGNNSFATIVSSSIGYIDASYYAKTRDNAIDLIFLPSRASEAITVTVEVYIFI